MLSFDIKGRCFRRFWANKGSILLPILALILMITILLSTVILYGSYHNHLIVKKSNEIKALYLAESALQFGLKRLSDEGYEVIDRFYSETIEGIGRIEYSIESYGVYLRCIGRGLAGKSKIELSGLLGRRGGNVLTSAINLDGAEYPLVLAGDTKIKGDVVVGASGVIPGKYKGREFRGSKLVDGRIIKDRIVRIPGINRFIYDKYIAEMETSSGDHDTTFESHFILTDDNYNLVKSYKKPYFKAGLNIRLSEKHLDLSDDKFEIDDDLEIGGNSAIFGFGLFKVNGDILIKDQAQLRDIVLMVDGNSELIDNTVIRCQIICSGTITVKDSSILERPGTLIADYDGEGGRIEYESGKISSGVAIVLADNYGFGHWGRENEVPRIVINPGSEWNGILYSEGFATIMGKVSGNVSTKGFYIYSEPTAYLNWLVDADISVDPEVLEYINPVILDLEGPYSYAYFH